MIEPSLAEVAIREAIANRGRITFREFMSMALYAAPGGYYSTGTSQIGAAGDYFTSPEVHPAFGALVARQIEQVWIFMGRPELFSVVEIGAGTGALARDILSYSSGYSPAFFEATEYVIVERNPELARLQQRTLAEIGPQGERVAWKSSAPQERRANGLVKGCVISNELLDAFPVHRVSVRDGRLREIYVGLEQDRLVEIEDDPSTLALPAYFDALGFLPPEGARAEVNLEALAWMRSVSEALGRGAVITIDYGLPAAELYSERFLGGTLHCFYRHTVTGNWFEHIGRQDITAHVDFTSVAREGEAHGLRPVGLCSQAEFLSRLGMDRYAALLPAMGLRAVDYESNRLGIRELTDPHGLGRIRVMIQQKGLDGLSPACLRPEGVNTEEFGRELGAELPPLLTRSHIRLDSPLGANIEVDTHGLWEELAREDDEE